MATAKATPRTRKHYQQQQGIASVRYRFMTAERHLIFSVPSRSVQGLEYMVTVGEQNRIHCTCPRGTYRGNCAHGQWVREWVEMRALARLESGIPAAEIERERERREQRSAYPYSDYGRGSYDFARDSNPHESGPVRYDPHGGMLD